MKEVTTFEFTELDTSDQAVAIIKKDDVRVSIALSIEHDGDLHVVMSKEDARLLVAALMTAIA